jgi:D-alanine-D-alanine ligase
MKIAIIYNLPENLTHSKDALADEEAITTANAIKEVLKKQNQVELFRVTPETLKDLKNYDLVFNLAENTEGCPLREDQITEFMEMNNILFTGAGSKALKECVDKVFSKNKFIENNIPTPGFQEFKSYDDELDKRLKFPLVVKPSMEDGSIGINEDSFVTNETALRKKVRQLLQRYKEPVMAEEYIGGQEINAAILANEILPLSEIVFELPEGKPKILTYECKWDTESEDYKKTMGRCPALLDKETDKKIKEIALRSAKLMDVRDYARVDFRVENNIPYVLEVNPNPCINPDGTGFLRSAAENGYDYSDIVNRIIDSAIKRKKRV